MRIVAFSLLAALTGFAVGCGKEYKPDPNPTGGGVHKPIEVGAGGAPVAPGTASIQGRWQLTKFEVSTDEVENATIGEGMVKSGFTVEITANTIALGIGKGAKEPATFRLRPGTREIDITATEARKGTIKVGADGSPEPVQETVTRKGIYELKGDTLKFAIQNSPDSPRPTEFKATGSFGDIVGSRPHVGVMHLRRIGGASGTAAKVTDTSDDEPAPDEPVKPAPKPPKKAPSAPVVIPPKVIVD